MNKLINRTARKSLAAALTVAALTTLAASATAAKASDQQATEAQMDNDLNYRAAGYPGLFNPQPRSGAYASARPDRKSTRLNSSHSSISYAVFCLKKKK